MRRPWELSRRTLLRGAGAAMALPLLEAMMPRTLRAQAAIAPTRLLFYYVPCGIYMQKWTPTRAGADWETTPILAPLEPFRDQLLVLTGIENAAGWDQGDGAGDHARGTGACLTATHVNKSSSVIINDISADQVAANALATQTLFRSLELGIEAGGTAGTCDSGYSCAYSNNIAWSGETTPVAKEIDPVAAFGRLFGQSGTGLSQAQLDRQRRYQTSVLDLVRDDALRLQSRLGASDKAKLDEYLTGVRELEQRIQASNQPLSCDPGAAPAPSTGVLDYPTRIQQMSDIMVLAFQCDMTRVISFMQANGGSNRVFPFLGIPQGHHYLSHHQDQPEFLEKLEIIDTWESEMLAYLLAGLRRVTEPDGSTLLDNTLVFYSSEISDGNAHNHDNMPILLAGSGGGAVTPGRHVVYDNKPPVANLFISMLRSVGLTVPAFGDDGYGELPGLKV